MQDFCAIPGSVPSLSPCSRDQALARPGDGFFMRQAGNNKPSAISIARRVSPWSGLLAEDVLRSRQRLWKRRAVRQRPGRPHQNVASPCSGRMAMVSAANPMRSRKASSEESYCRRRRATDPPVPSAGRGRSPRCRYGPAPRASSLPAERTRRYCALRDGCGGRRCVNNRPITSAPKSMSHVSRLEADTYAHSVEVAHDPGVSSSRDPLPSTAVTSRG